MTTQARPNLGGLFDGSTPADRTSSVAGRLGPRLVAAPAGGSREQPAPASSRGEPEAEAKASKVAEPAASSPGSGSTPRPSDPLAWIDPMRALETYFNLLQAVFDANRQFVMGLAGVLMTSGTRVRSGLDSIRTRP